jgi:nitrogen regulatory protein PII
MDLTRRKLVNIVTESALENRLAEDLTRLGAKGYTVLDARGRGARGVRAADFDQASNVCFQIVCKDELAERILTHVYQNYYANYAMIATVTEVDVLRPGKF